ncbi:MAG: hypothetical protein ACREV6_08555 [Clostridium sp.]|uniref:hypothetical protein n=1 Tax=Clostridium sp. TaxID=1506 RepID=UPI003D6D80A4
MKKRRILVAAVIVTTMLVGAGFAAWTDKLTVNSTVSTGELNVKFTECTMYKDNEIGIGDYAKTDFNPSYIEGNTNTKSLDLTLNNLYPGVSAILCSRFENNGTIPAVIKSVVITEETAILKGLNNKDLVKMTDDEKAKITVVGNIKQYREAGDTIKIVKRLAINTNLRDLQTVLNGTSEAPGLATWKLEPNDYAKIEELKFELPSQAVTGDEMENTYEKFKLEINFVQHNQ